jgi:lipopolysaccharide export system protein LptA
MLVFLYRLSFLFTACLSAGLGCVMNNAYAEKADRDKPLDIQADRLVRDDIKQISTFTGNVILTKGTIILRGDKLVVTQDPEAYQYGVMTGKQASFRQKRDGLDQFVEGFGLEISYDGKTEIVRFNDKAYVRRLEKTKVMDEIQGKVVVYDARNENYIVESGGTGTTATNPDGRVRVTIQPKNPETVTPAVNPNINVNPKAAPARNNSGLQSATSLGLTR